MHRVPWTISLGREYRSTLDPAVGPPQDQLPSHGDKLMAAVVFHQADTYLVKSIIPGAHTCSNPSCPQVSDQERPTYIYWFTEDVGSAPPLGMTQAYCSDGCFWSRQNGPTPIGRPREWAERFPPGQYGA